MKIDLTGRVALVTGGSKGIGLAIAQALAECDANVSVVARSPADLSSALETLPATTPAPLAVCADVAVSEEVERAVSETADHFGGLDIVVCNAGGAGTFGAFEDLSEAEWENTFRVNVMHAVFTVKAALPFLRLSASPRILLIASTSGFEPGLMNPHYTTTKAATINLAKYLSRAYAGEGILVNVICPGPIMTPAMSSFVSHHAAEVGEPVDKMQVEFETREAAKVPLGRIGAPRDVGPLVAFLASDHAGWITGSAFTVDGGKSARI